MLKAEAKFCLWGSSRTIDLIVLENKIHNLLLYVAAINFKTTIFYLFDIFYSKSLHSVFLWRFYTTSQLFVELGMYYKMYYNVVLTDWSLAHDSPGLHCLEPVLYNVTCLCLLCQCYAIVRDSCGQCCSCAVYLLVSVFVYCVSLFKILNTPEQRNKNIENISMC